MRRRVLVLVVLSVGAVTTVVVVVEWSFCRVNPWKALSLLHFLFFRRNREEPVAGSVQTKMQDPENPNRSSSAKKKRRGALRVAADPLRDHHGGELPEHH